MKTDIVRTTYGELVVTIEQSNDSKLTITGQHFITFQKRKGLYLTKGRGKNEELAKQVTHELVKNGYAPTKELYEVLCTQNKTTLTNIHKDLTNGFGIFDDGNNYEPIYRNFPQSVKAISQLEFVMNAIVHYWTMGTWRPDDVGHLTRETATEPINYKGISLLTEGQFNGIFIDILYSGNSISAWDRHIIDWYIENSTVTFEFDRIKFNETKAYVGQRFMELDGVITLPTRSATTVLRILAGYSGGDEGLKKFDKPFRKLTTRQTKMVLATLNECYNLEDSFKSYREPWLRVLHYLWPNTRKNKIKYPLVARCADALSNDPKSLETFNAKVERMIINRDTAIFNLLAKSKGVFMRRLDHLVRVFGADAVDRFLATNPNFGQLVNIYNHFGTRDTSHERSAILASASASNVATYSALDALPKELCDAIQVKSLAAMHNRVAKTGKVYIDRSLYFTPYRDANRRASSFSLADAATGQVVKINHDKTIRLYVRWHGSRDIDLSGLLIDTDNTVVKVGWNGRGYVGAVTYSGDNTGDYDQNTEYIDIDISALSANIEWIIVDANIYSGGTFDDGRWSKPVIAGWMTREFPEKNILWKPDTVDHAIQIKSNAKNAYLMAYNVPTKSLVYLDVALTGQTNVTTTADAVKFRVFLENSITLDKSAEIPWKKLNAGHIAHILASKVVNSPDEADIVLNDQTPLEEITKAVSDETLTIQG